MKPGKIAKKRDKTNKTKNQANTNFARRSIICALEDCGWQVVEFSHPLPEDD